MLFRRRITTIAIRDLQIWCSMRFSHDLHHSFTPPSSQLLLRSSQPPRLPRASLMTRIDKLRESLCLHQIWTKLSMLQGMVCPRNSREAPTLETRSGASFYSIFVLPVPLKSRSIPLQCRTAAIHVRVQTPPSSLLIRVSSRGVLAYANAALTAVRRRGSEAAAPCS